MPRQYRRDRDSDPDRNPAYHHHYDNDTYNDNDDYEYDSSDEDPNREPDYRPNFGFNSRLPFNLRGFVPVWNDPDGYNEHDHDDNVNNGHGHEYGNAYDTRRTVAPEESATKHQSVDSSNSAAHLLAGQDHEDRGYPDEGLRVGKRRSQRKKALLDGLGPGAGAGAGAARDITRDRPQGRIVSGAHLEEGRGQVRQRSGFFPAGGAGGGGGGAAAAGPGEELLRKEGNGGNWNGSTVSSNIVDRPFYKRKRWWLGMGILLLILAAIAVPVAVVMTRKHTNKHTTSAGTDSDSSDDNAPANLNLKGISRDSIPSSAKGTILDPFTWYDTTDFNVTYTNATVGGLPLMGLNSSWDDSTQANEHVPPLNESFPYGSQPIRGVNLGGWLSIEPFIVPSFFDKYDSWEGIVDEYTLTQRLGDAANATLEKHYAKFITEQDFIDIRDAGLDHVRIQYSYWAIKTFDENDKPYVSQIAWRYLLRAIEYCRKYGLRVNLDLHGLVGSQNGWNHSGRQGAIGWLNGTDGALNRKRSLELHDSLSKFFAQDRYKNIVTIYGLVNEPLMLSLPIKDVLEWTTEVTKLVQGNNITAWIAFHDGFLNLSKWKKMLKGDDVPDNMLLDTHQYTIFNTGQIVLKHADRVNLICNDWYHMIQEINTTDAGYLPSPHPLSPIYLCSFSIAEVKLISYTAGGGPQSAANGPPPTPTARRTSTTSAAAPAGKELFPPVTARSTVPPQTPTRSVHVRMQTRTPRRILMGTRSSCRHMRRRR